MEMPYTFAPRKRASEGPGAPLLRTFAWTRSLMNEQNESRHTLVAPSPPPRGWIRWTALVLALAGWWLSMDLTRVGYGKQASNPWLQARCGAEPGDDARFDCQSVLNSASAFIPLSSQPGAPRLPVAVLGMGYFAFLGLWYLFVGPPTRARWGWHALPLIVVGCGVLQSLHMMHVMADVLHKWCAGCVATHAVNAGLALLTIIAAPWRRDRPGASPHPSGRLALASLTAAVLIFAIHPAVMLMAMMTSSRNYVAREYSKIVDDPEFARWSYSREAQRPELNADGRTLWGDPDAPNTVTEFFDVQCGPCMTAHEVLRELMQEHPGLLRVDSRHFPLDNACNDSVPRSEYPASCAAARAAEAARTVDGDASFQEMRTFLYEHRHELEAAPFAEWAGQLGLDREEYSAALSSSEIADLIQADIELGKKVGVGATPAIYLNGRRLSHWKNPATWEALLGLERDASTPTP